MSEPPPRKPARDRARDDERGGPRARPRFRTPKLSTTTLWYHPSAQYTEEPMGLRGYEGATPPWIVWNLLTRYTREDDLVVDPFCGGGTTLDVAQSLGRKSLGYDLNPVRPDIVRADARALPLAAEQVDFLFMDPPYSTHIEYSEDPRCIGKLSAFDDAYYAAMSDVFREAERVLRDRRYLALFVSDSWDKKHGFAPIATRLGALLGQRFRPIDHIAVVRGNRDLEKPNYHKAAAEGNFFLRGFTHLLLFKKERAASRPELATKGAKAQARRASTSDQ